MSKKIQLIVLTLLVLISSVSVFAQNPDQIIANSDDWEDVYSVMLYGSLNGQSTSFLVSDKHSTLILGTIPPGAHIWAISSKNAPYVAGYEAILKSRGYSAEEFIYDNVNIEIAKILNVTNFIILDPSYGYNAISVAPYAVVTKSYVLFADRENIGEVIGFLNTVKVDKMIIYGHVDREVRDAMQEFNPEIIDKEGDRFQNNIEIVKKFQEIRGANQVILTNGEFIEKEIMSGSEPVIFIGTNNVPDVVREYIQGSNIQVGVLIGNELVGTATFIRRQVGISVFVKFAQGSREQKGAISQVEALDMFYLPVYTLNLELAAVKYNRAANQLEVTLRNTQEQAVYFIGTYTLTASDGTRQTVGDKTANFLDGNDIKTIVYKDIQAMPEGRITADVFIIYGESKGALEKEIRKTVEVDTVRVLDTCEINKDNVKLQFNKANKFFYINVENNGDVDCYVDAEIVDLLIAGEKRSFGLDKATKIKSKTSANLRIKVADFEEEDIADNEKVRLRIYYGEREDSLVKVFEGLFALAIKGVDYLFYSLLIIIFVLLLLIVWKRYKKRKKEPIQQQPS